MKVVEIEEVDHSIHLQFQISLKWKENRVKYQNLICMALFITNS